MNKILKLFSIILIITLQSCLGFSIYTIDADANEGGEISPSGTVPVREFQDQTFNFHPNEGYELVDVNVDGYILEGISSYTFIRVIGNHTINVNFRSVEENSGVNLTVR